MLPRQQMQREIARLQNAPSQQAAGKQGEGEGEAGERGGEGNRAGAGGGHRQNEGVAAWAPTAWLGFLVCAPGQAACCYPALLPRLNFLQKRHSRGILATS